MCTCRDGDHDIERTRVRANFERQGRYYSYITGVL